MLTVRNSTYNNHKQTKRVILLFFLFYILPLCKISLCCKCCTIFNQLFNNLLQTHNTNIALTTHYITVRLGAENWKSKKFPNIISNQVHTKCLKTIQENRKENTEPNVTRLTVLASLFIKSLDGNDISTCAEEKDWCAVLGQLQ